MKNYLFYMSFGPVQSFIAQARKTHDLNTGSAILSTLTETALETLAGSGQLDKTVLPAPEIESKPNLFVARVKVSDDEELTKLAATVENKTRDKLNEIFRSGLRNLGGNEDQTGLAPQLNNFLRVLWTAVPAGDNYKQDFDDLMARAAMLKASHLPRQVSEEARARCHQCGERLALVEREDDTGRLKPGEKLCGICAAKRGFKTGSRKAYPSTAQIALMRALDSVGTHPSLEELRSELEEAARENDSQLYFGDNLDAGYLRANFSPKSASKLIEKLPQLRDMQRSLQREAAAKGQAWSKYYALIMMDGDKMGEWIQGARLRDKGELEKFHAALSRGLGKFSQAMKELFRAPNGSLVYAGGDDLLAFCPLGSLFSNLEKVNQAFREATASEIGGFNLAEEGGMTASAGVCVAHYRMPLGMVVEEARRLEKGAKSGGRDRFHLGILKHSGERLEFHCRWDAGEAGARRPTQIMTDLFQGIEDKAFSTSFIHQTVETFRPLGILDWQFGDPANQEFQEMILSETRRLFGRSVSENTSTSGVPDIDFGDLLTGLGGRDFCLALLVTDFFARRLGGE